MDEPFKQVQFRMYHNKELPDLIGLPKATLNRDLKPLRKQLGPRMGHHWTFEQVIKILKIFAIPYIVVQ
jgi:hypothetical protein